MKLFAVCLPVLTLVIAASSTASPTGNAASCRIGDPNYKPITCNRDRNAWRDCVINGLQPPERPTIAHVQGRAYRLTFHEPDASGCSDIGRRTVRLQLRAADKAPADPAMRPAPVISKTVVVRSIKRFRFNRVLSLAAATASFGQCEIQLTATQIWSPKGNWAKRHKRATKTYSSKAQSC
jgi:hypothetical protein